MLTINETERRFMKVYFKQPSEDEKRNRKRFESRRTSTFKLKLE
jgi:hypothetical protein